MEDVLDDGIDGKRHANDTKGEGEEERTVGDAARHREYYKLART